MRRILAATAVLGMAAVGAADAPKQRAPQIRLVHIYDGLRPAAPGADLAKLPVDFEVRKLAREAGIDLLKPPHPMLAHSYANGRLFYVFFKTVEGALGDRAYLLQRIRKTERTWKAGSPTPEEKVTYQVEVFRTIAGALKRPDQHHGWFSLRDAKRREVVKEYELGFGEVPGVCEGTAWPFSDGTLFHMIQPYGEDAALYEKARFTAATKWSLVVSLADDGTYAIRSPELKIDAPRSLPDPDAARPKPDDASRDVVLVAGQGLGELVVGRSTAEDLRRALGAPLEDAITGGGHRNLSFEKSLTFNLDEGGLLNTVITRSAFAGKTAEGIGHGATRAQVMEKMGVPKGQASDAHVWSFDGVQLTFDGFDRVERIVIFRPQAK